MKLLPIRTMIGEGEDKQVSLLFSGPRRKIMQITLRRGATLARHTAAVPITVQCLAGSGTFHADDSSELIELTAGVLLTVEANVPHEVRSSPSVSILVTQFTDG